MGHLQTLAQKIHALRSDHRLPRRRIHVPPQHLQRHQLAHGTQCYLSFPGPAFEKLCLENSEVGWHIRLLRHTDIYEEV